MFNDRQKALEELEAELLLEEILEEEERRKEMEELGLEPEEAQPIYRNFSNNYGRVEAYNRDVAREALEEYSDEVLEEPPKENVQGLLTLALLLLTGIFGMLAFWAIRYL